MVFLLLPALLQPVNEMPAAGGIEAVIRWPPSTLFFSRVGNRTHLVVDTEGAEWLALELSRTHRYLLSLQRYYRLHHHHLLHTEEPRAEIREETT